MGLVEELAGQVGMLGACQALNVPRSWYYRQRKEHSQGDRA
jgi:hypothetical protein